MQKPMIELELDACVACGAESVKQDKMGLYWCADCTQRGDLLNWGIAHHYPRLHAGVYAIAAGIAWWVAVTIFGSDELIWMMLGVISEQEEREEIEA